MRQLAERFWNLAKSLDAEAAAEEGETPDPVAVAKHVLRILDALEGGAGGTEVSVSTQSFLILLRQHELEGDLLYASPEQARGEMVDERSLVFSVGVLLFEKLTGRHPFGAETNPNRLARMQKGQIGSGVNYFPIVPAGLRTVLMRAMGPFPEERWSSLAEMRAQLELFVEESSAGKPKLPPRPSKVVTILPAKGKPAGDNDATRVVAMPAKTPEPPKPREEPPPEVTVRRAPRETMRVATQRGPEWLRPLLWAGAGAAFTAAIFTAINIWRTGPAPEERPVTAAPAPVVTPAPAAPAPTVAPEAPVAAPTAPPPPTPANAVFDPADIGKRGGEALRACFPPAKLAGAGGFPFGVTLVFPAHALHADKLYFGAEPMTGGERKCVKAALTGIDAGAAPETNVILEYGFRVRADRVDVRTKIAKQP